MDLIHIAELHPELSARDTKQFKAAVTLIWPYSSSQRQFALLLAETDFRLRRKKGQVRARFSGSSAKALATTGVGIGDEVILSLRGAQFVQEDIVSTPGRSIDWELEYTQTVAVQVFRDGAEVANLELQDAAPTPAPRSPVRRQTNIHPSPTQQWSSPAFLKRARLSDGPFFEAPYDPLADENAEGHDKKRRRKSYRDWKAWTYNARTPSPEKGDVEADEDMDAMEVSPSRLSQLPRTPVSPPKPQLVSVTAGRLHGAKAANAQVPEQENAKTSQTPNEDFVHDEEYYDLYAGPDEDRPSDAQYAFGGDTEANTEEDGEALEDTDAASMSPTEAGTQELEQVDQEPDHECTEKSPTTRDRALFEAETGSTTEEDGLPRGTQTRDPVVVTIDEDDSTAAEPATVGLARTEGASKIGMPPPTLPSLNTSFHGPVAPDPLTPIGKEPASPTLQPLDSALLPLPSPFPGERDPGSMSYFEQALAHEQSGAQETEEEGPPSEADYIMENSFFSSIGSSKTNAFHPDHESAFTPVRFTFGMDGAWSSRPLDLSSPAPEHSNSRPIEDAEHEVVSAAVENIAEIPETAPSDVVRDFKALQDGEASVSSILVAEESTLDQMQVERSSSVRGSPEPRGPEPEVIELSSGSEAEESDGSETEGDAVPVEVAPTNDSQQDNARPTSTDRSAAPSTTADLRSPSASHGMVDAIPDTLDYTDADEARRAGLPPFAESSSKAQDDTATLEMLPVEPGNDHSYSELTAVDYPPVYPDFITNAQETATAHAATQERLQDLAEADKDEQPLMMDLSEPYPAIGIPDTFMEENLLDADPFQGGQWATQDTGEVHLDVKMESVEESSVFRIGELETQEEREGQEVTTEPFGELLIEVPEEGHKVGELHTISVLATSPARNTRSKTKTSASPAKENISPPKRTTRSTNSKASVTPIARTTMSPPMTRHRSTISPSMDAPQTSPYSLRSSSKLLSPTKSTSVNTSAMRQSPREHASQQSVDSVPDIGSSQVQDTDAFLDDFPPLQELGASQGKYSNVSLVKDSEEESLHSAEQSLSTVRYSDDWNTFTNFVDPLAEREQDDFANLKPAPASASQAETRAAVGAESNRSGQQADIAGKSIPARSDLSQPPQSSPSRKLRSAGSSEAASFSPHVTRVTHQHARDISIASQPEEEPLAAATLKAQDIDDPTPLEGGVEVTELPSSPPASANVNEAMRNSPPATLVTSLPLNRQSVMDGNTLITPDATQQANMESQSSLTTHQQEQETLPLTPQLTQATSAGLRSFKKSATTESTTVETFTQSSPTRITRSTPRRNATQSDVVSPSTTPKARSPDMSSDLSITAVEESEEPSIGLSTPLAYYTPLKSLPYFVNRSSQFDTSSNPDVFALVTSGSTPPQRATKGRKDWTTTLHITDISTYPATTSVNIFRPYQNALPAADTGDIILLRAFAVKSLNRHPTLTSADESSWCVWRYAKPVWGAKRGAYGELKAREEVKGPEVERGEGERREVEKIRMWYVGRVKGELVEKVHTRSQDGKEVEGQVVEGSQRVTRSRVKKTSEEEA
jgi:hypothetical protein